MLGGSRGKLPCKNWCILGVPKYVIINLKSIILRKINQQQPKFCAIFFSKINPDVHVSTKINTFTIYKGGLWAIATRSHRNVKKIKDFPF